MSSDLATVYFADLRADTRINLYDKVDALLVAVGLLNRFRRGHLVAVKLHFGERGNTAYIRPPFVRRVVERVRETGAAPFLTDTNTLYVGSRTNSVSHLKVAVENGFAYSVVGAPIIIADGLRGEAGVYVEVGGSHLEKVSIAREITAADGLVVMTHFKCHEMSGFGGAIKNIGMGCAAREGKLAQHSNCAPVVDPAGCNGCGDCALICPADAIEVGAVAVIEGGVCIGCGHCIAACPEGAIKVEWNESTSRMQEKMAEHALGAVKGKDGRCVFLNFLTDVSPACDCYGHADRAIVPNVGILASTDPVAIDQASADLVNGQEGFPDSALKDGHERGGDKFRGVYPEIDWGVQLDTSASLGLGTRRYRLEKV
jgi:uncharacterized Fe-S center protein